MTVAIDVLSLTMKLGDKSSYIDGDESWLNMGLMPDKGTADIYVSRFCMQSVAS